MEKNIWKLNMNSKWFAALLLETIVWKTFSHEIFLHTWTQTVEIYLSHFLLQQYIDARTYIVMEFELEKPLVPKREQEILWKR